MYIEQQELQNIDNETLNTLYTYALNTNLFLSFAFLFFINKVQEFEHYYSVVISL